MRQWTVDAFASEAFKGNPACVLEPFDAWPQDGWMQALASENNQAETAYLRRTSDPARFELRWFTPTVEVPLCGHATLAAAHVLWRELGWRGERIVFETKSGPLSVSAVEEALQMDFPADRPRNVATPPGLADALGATPQEVWAGRRFLVAVLAGEDEVRGLRPDLAALAHLGAGENLGDVAVVAKSDPDRGYDVVSRFFAPGSGIPEDPATGSLHCILAPLYADKLGRPRNRFHQAYPGRGGDLDCEIRGERVIIVGQAITVMESTLRPPASLASRS